MHRRSHRAAVGVGVRERDGAVHAAGGGRGAPDVRREGGIAGGLGCGAGGEGSGVQVKRKLG